MGLKVCCWIHANSLSFPLNYNYHFENRQNHQTFIARLPVFLLGRLPPSFKARVVRVHVFQCSVQTDRTYIKFFLCVEDNYVV